MCQDLHDKFEPAQPLDRVHNLVPNGTNASSTVLPPATRFVCASEDRRSRGSRRRKPAMTSAPRETFGSHTVEAGPQLEEDEAKPSHQEEGKVLLPQRRGKANQFSATICWALGYHSKARGVHSLSRGPLVAHHHSVLLPKNSSNNGVLKRHTSSTRFLRESAPTNPVNTPANPASCRCPVR